MKRTSLLYLVAVTAMSLALLLPPGGAAFAQEPAPTPPQPDVQGPFIGEPAIASVFDGDLRDLAQLPRGTLEAQENPHPPIPGKWPTASDTFIDPVVQTWQGPGQMPSPIMNFEGVEGSDAGSWAPPDTNGDVGPNHYIETVNVGIGIYDKASGAELVNLTLNQFMTGINAPAPCDTQNRGDPIVLHDHLADRWIVTDFSLPSGGPYYECIAISQSGDPVGGGWYSYAYEASPAGSSWNDYPKLGVWPDAYYMTANMFEPSAGARVWALNRDDMLSGAPLRSVSFGLGTSYWSLLPANLEGPLPPPGAPNYLASINYPRTLRLWEFHVDWAVPGNSTLTGPANLTVADYGLIWNIPQPSPGVNVDSLGDRLMMQLQYRNFGSHESLWVNHTVASGGVSGVRWYEVRDPGGTPTLYQQGTYQPADGLYRWMGSVAVDGDGNMALGYSVSSGSLFPAIRYTGRLAGDVLGTLPQGETSLIEGGGVQTGTDRWGDYSAMVIDPVDDCTFWYTQEYYAVTSSRNWQTRIGSFRFPSCGQSKGWIEGTVRDAYTTDGIPNAPVVAESVTTTLSVSADASGYYSMSLPAGIYNVTAGPLPPGYPISETVPGVAVTALTVTPLDIDLVPEPYLEEDTVSIDDAVAGGNGNGYPEPGERGILVWESLENTGATTATQVTAHLSALTPGVTVTVAAADYPDVGAGTSETNLTPFAFSVDPSVPCGAVLDFQKVVTAAEGVYTVAFSLTTGVPLPIAPFFEDDMESGSGGWTTGGAQNYWAITEEQAHSPTHAWSDSPSSDYRNNANAWLRSPVLDLSDRDNVSFSFWHRYDLENSWDFGRVEYSLDGGGTWEAPLASYTGAQNAWIQEEFAMPTFDRQPSVAFRFRLQSDGNTTEDGWYIDDVTLSHQPYACVYLPAPVLLAPPDGTITTTNSITLTWEPGAGSSPEGYNLELDGVVFTTTGTLSPTILATGVHTWRVRAFYQAGASAYSNTWQVTVEEPFHTVYLPIVLRDH